MAAGIQSALPGTDLGMLLQLRKECELMQQRAEAAEGVVERERGLHRRELRRRAKELADMQEDLVQVKPYNFPARLCRQCVCDHMRQLVKLALSCDLG